MKLNGWFLGDARYRAMLDYIAPKCYVEASTTRQGGEVLDVIYNMYDVPVCLKVRHGSGKIDYISVDRIDFWEPFNNFYTDLSEYEDSEGEGLVEALLEAGYVWDDKRECYYNEEYDDEIDWQVR